MTPLSRRALLRGALGGVGVGVALPWLEAALPSGAHADEGSYPDRFGLWFYGNGVKPERWVPPTIGAGWTPSEELAPLADLTGYVSPISGFEMKTATHPHHSGMAGILTGERYFQLGTTRDTIVSTFARRSVDQDAAAWFVGRTRFRSLEVGVTRFWGTDEGSTFEHVSHNGPNAPNPAEYDPVRLFARLFTEATDVTWNTARRSVLDAVGEHTRRLQQRLGAADRARMEQHLESVRSLELRLGASPSACIPPAEPAPMDEPLAQEAIAERNQVQSELLALALSCDLARAFTVQFSSAGAGTVFWQVGSADGMHLLCHTEGAEQPQVHAGVVFTMEQLAAFLRVLRDTPEGEGNLLDHSSILAVTELSEGQTHSNQEFPILIAGGGNGRLRPGIHVRDADRRNTSDAVLTALHGAGVALPEWGAAAGYTDRPIAELLR